jgi:hypothetical protein
VGKNFLQNGMVELELRKDGTKFSLDEIQALEMIKNYPEQNNF